MIIYLTQDWAPRTYGDPYHIAGSPYRRFCGIWSKLDPGSALDSRILFKRPLAGAAAQRFFKIFEKIEFFEKLVKICFLTLFGPIWTPDSNSA